MKPYTSYLEWIETQNDRLLDCVRRWVGINSYSNNLVGLSELHRTLSEDFACLEGDVKDISLPYYQVIDDKGDKIELPLGQALSIRKRPEAPIQIFLGGHMDTVFTPASSFQTIEELSSTIWQGPGVVDMKGGLAIMLIALAALERSPFADNIGWEILINPDEEIGSPGSSGLFEQAAKRNLVGLIFEPSFPDGAFVSARKGSANYSVIVRGKSAHVGRDFAKGRSAIYALAELINGIDKVQLSDPENIINVGHISGGGPVNIVPDLALAKVNFRSSKEEVIQKSLGFMQNLAEKIRQREGISVDIIPGTIRFPRPYNLPIQQLFYQYAECAKQLHLPVSFRETGGVCDGNILAHHGLPTLDSVGAIGGHMHTSKEYLLLPSLIERGKLAALFLMKIAAGEIELEKEPAHA